MKDARPKAKVSDFLSFAVQKLGRGWKKKENVEVKGRVFEKRNGTNTKRVWGASVGSGVGKHDQNT